MKESSKVFRASPEAESRALEQNGGTRFRAGTRGSNLALAQTRETVQKIEALLPAVTFETVRFLSPGDRDRETDLRKNPPDFFTRDLDRAVCSGEIDCAIHSAKDLPDPSADGLDWFWLPWRVDPRDVLILRAGETLTDLPKDSVIGVSSERREAYCRKRFRGARIKPVRGDVEVRLAKLDAGEYDILILAAAGLQRLGLDHRISEYIPLDELEPPAGQGYLAVTFPEGDERFLQLRRLFMKSVVFVGAGPGDQKLCTVAGRDALQYCDVCFYDTLAAPELLDWLSAGAEAVYVGKRSGHHDQEQNEICRLLTMYARRGRNIVRLKGGDPGVFGRLAEETTALDKLQLPYRVIPGVSSLNAATTSTGLTLTRRGVSHGFSVMTPIGAEGEEISVGAEKRRTLPVTFFMSVSRLERIFTELIKEGRPASTPCAMVFDAGKDSEEVLCNSLAGMRASVGRYENDRPGILIVGDVASDRFLYRQWGALEGRKVLLTCSEALIERATREVHHYGGHPVKRPLIRLVPEAAAKPLINQVENYNWVVLTSPSAVDCLMSLLTEVEKDVRVLPRILAGGFRTADQLKQYNLTADAVAREVSGGSWEVVRKKGQAPTTQHLTPDFEPGARVLRLRSDAVGDSLAKALAECGYSVTDFILYRNEAIRYAKKPSFDAAFFASGSAVKSFAENWDIQALYGKETVVIGNSTAKVLQSFGLEPTVIASEATVEHSIGALAAWYVNKKLIG